MSLSGKRFIPTPTTWQWSARSVVVGTDPAHFCPTTTQISSARVSRTTLRRSVPSGSPQSTCAFWTTPPVDERFVDQIGALVAARDDGLIAGIGISNVTHQHLVRALEVTDIVCVQNWYNLADRSASRVLDECIVRGIAFVPFGPLGRGDVIRANPASPPASPPAMPRHLSRSLLGGCWRSPTTCCSSRAPVVADTLPRTSVPIRCCCRTTKSPG